MGTRKRRGRAESYRAGDCTLGWRKGWAVADFRNEGTGKRQRVRLGRFNKSDQKARDALDAFAEARRAVQAHTKAHTVGQLWQMWLDDRAEDGFSNAIYEAQWVSLKPVFANRAPHLLTVQDFRDYARARFKLGRSQWTVHNELVRMRTCMKWAHEMGKIDKRPKVWVPSAGGHRDRVLSFDEARSLVAAAMQGDPHISLFVVVAFATGARHTAILDLTWDRVDFVEGTIEFDERLPRDPMSRSWRKGRATVPMNRAVRAALELAHKGRRTDHVIEHGGRRLKTVRSGFAAAVERAALGDDVTPHIIRHTVLTWLDAGSVETRRAAQLAGHKDERTTKSVYTHAAPDVLKEAVELLGDAFTPLARIEIKPADADSGGNGIAEDEGDDEPDLGRNPARLSHRDNGAKKGVSKWKAEL